MSGFICVWLCLSLLHAYALAQLKTTTSYETVIVSDPNGPVVSTVGYCNPFPGGLQLCNNVIWPNLQSDPSATGFTLGPAPEPSAIPSSFVLGGSGTLEGFYLHFDTTGNVLLEALGSSPDILLALHLENTVAILQRAEDISQLVYLRHNNSFIEEIFRNEEQSVINIIRQARIGTSQQLVSLDLLSGWVWHNETNEVRFLNGDETLSFYYIPSTLPQLRSRRDTYERDRNLAYLLFALPLDFPLSSDSLLRPLRLTPAATSTLTRFFTKLTSGSSPASSTPPSSTQTSPMTFTIVSTPPSTPASTPASTPDSTPPSSPASTPSSAPQSSLPPIPTDAYDVITQYALQDYCTSLLGYFSPTETLSSTIYTTTSTTTDFNTITTSTTTTRSTTTSTSYTTHSKPSFLPCRDLDPPVPTQLSAYAASAVQSACSRAITSPEDTATIYNVLSTNTITSVSADTTEISTKISTVSTVATATQTEIFPAIGLWTVTQQDDDATPYKNGSYWSYVLAEAQANSAGVNSALGYSAEYQNKLSLQVVNMAAQRFAFHTHGLATNYVLCGSDTPAAIDPSNWDYWAAIWFKASIYAVNGYRKLVFKYDYPLNQAYLDIDDTYASQPLHWWYCINTGNYYAAPLAYSPENDPTYQGNKCARIPSRWALNLD
ncbi:hypothetical protein AA313_de0203452 [Arthrobotrys entomopaga]|nr:hypothetical protein AA313_de0203452 [Arthrobotrys entomopaga]